MRLLAIALLQVALGVALAQEQPVKPNIVIIYADDLGYGDLSCYGATKLKTPNIDRLAKEGRRFTDAHSTSAVCTPSRYALLTGRYPARINNWGPTFCRSKLIIDTKRETVASLLKTAGYSTACIGKWHLGFGSKPNPNWNKPLKPGPLELGFDHYYGVPVVNSHAPFVYVEDHLVVGLDPKDPLRYVNGGKTHSKPYPEKHAVARGKMPVLEGGKKAHDLYVDEEVATHLTGKAVDWLKKQSKDKPFFLYLATTNIHHPFTPHKRFQGTSDCGLYGDFVHELDWIVGEVLKTLDEMGVAKNTMVIFTSDNGGMLNGGGRAAWAKGHEQNGKLLGHKFGAWEGGHRIPFIVRWPNRVPAGSTSDALISNLDMIATFAKMTGQTLEKGQGGDSLNQLETLTGAPAKPVRTELMLQPHKPTHASLRQGDWMYIPARGDGGFGNGIPMLATTKRENSDVQIVNGKAVVKKGAPKEQLYNLKSDPYQTQNVIRQHPEAAEQMKARLGEILKDMPNAQAHTKRNRKKKVN